MERAHVLVRLRGDASVSGAAGICRTSATTVRLEHSEMSPGVASITFEQVFDVDDSNTCVFQTSLTDAVDAVVDGKAATLIATGATNSGKSFACHGDHHKQSNGKAEPGLITLAIRRVFSDLETKLQSGVKCNVLLSCWGIARSELSEQEALTDLLSTGTYIDAPVEDMGQVLLNNAMVVSTHAEAVHLYSKALANVKKVEKQDFVIALHVETLSPHGEARRGRLLIMDLHGGAIVEPQGDTNKVEKKERLQCFLDTQFPVNKALSAGFGAFVGNTSATYLLVTIQTPAQFQQQAIQSLLYACKAKEIKSSSSVNFLPAFVKRNNHNCTFETQKRPSGISESQTAGCSEDYVVPMAPHSESSEADKLAAICSDRPLRLESPPLSTTSSDSTCEIPFLASPTKNAVLPSRRTNDNERPEKQSSVSRRVRRAYDIAKASTRSQAKSRILLTASSNQGDVNVVHTAVDGLLKHLPRDTLRGLSFEDKLDQIRLAQSELERALAHEISIKDKCVDRISRLSQTMSCQVVEHEQQLQEALTAKHTAETQLQELNIKFDDVGREVTCLQKEVKKLKSGQNLIANSEDVQALENERTTLHTLSARLEEAMIQAKDVITFKDGVIESLEARLQLASKRGADAATLLKEERDRFEREKSDLLIQLQENKNSQNSTKDEEVLNLRKENMATQQQKAELTVKVAQLTLELETVRSQWTHDVRDKDRVEQGCARQVAEAEQQLEQATAAMQQQMAQFRNELDMKVARQRVATQVACKAGELKCDQLERELQRMRLKLGKQKAKLDKKARILVANSHEQHKESVVSLQRELADLSERMNIVLEKEQKAMKRAQKSEEAVEQLQAELKGSAMELDRERAALGNMIKELEKEKNALNAHKQHNESVVVLQRELADLSERMNIVLEKEQKAMKRAQKSEEAVEQLRAELKGSAMELERERTAVWNVNKELETEKNAMKAEFELRAREMEQSVAKQIAEAESRVHEERDGQVQMLLEQHDAVVNRLKAVVREQEKTNTTMPRVTRQESSSTVSSSGEDESVSSNYSHQQSINELDALIDAKERRYRQPEKWRKPKDTSRPSSSPPTKDTSSSLKRTLAHKEEEITELSTRQKQLLAALATANEQETLAKQQIHETEVQRQQELVRYEALLQQLNSVKHENWNLSLALHVTETTHQQRRSLQTNPIY